MDSLTPEEINAIWQKIHKEIIEEYYTREEDLPTEEDIQKDHEEMIRWLYE
jgi:hypothetical protein